jgi:CBS domain-containing protein
MRIEDLMTRPAVVCGANDPLSRAAQLMWEADIGSVVVVGELGEARGIVTDRDIAMATLLEGRPPHEIPVERAMSWPVFACQASDSLEIAAILMAQKQVRRIAIVDDASRPIGVVSIGDIARRAFHGGARNGAAEEIVELLSMICEPRRRAAVARTEARA